MNKKFFTPMVVALCMISSMAFADHNYQERNVFNRFTDWKATVGKSHDTKQQVLDERAEARAYKREASVTYKQRKANLKKEYRQDLVNIYDNNGDNAQVMADKLKAANAEYKMKMEDLKKGVRNE